MLSNIKIASQVYAESLLTVPNPERIGEQQKEENRSGIPRLCS